MDVLLNTKYMNVDQAKLNTLFKFLAFCLKRVVADNELGGLEQALEGKFVEPSPGRDPIRNPKVLPIGKNIHAFGPIGYSYYCRSYERQDCC